MAIVKSIISKVPVKLKRNLKRAVYWFLPFCINFTLDNDLNSLKRKVNLYFFFFCSKRKKFIDEINFLNKNSDIKNSHSIVFPYPFVLNYDYTLINVYKDEIKGLYYVIHNGKKLYYSRDYKSELAVKLSYTGICIEQDKRSPHLYLNDDFRVEENDVVLDIGAAEGNFSLDVIERAGTLYIFETDINWIEALNATFEPWKEKVHIINKAVTDQNNANCVTLDKLLGDSSVNFIKMDVEGAEVLVLRGSVGILENNKSLKLVLCTYHRRNDAEAIGKLLCYNGFNCSFSEGYMLFIYDKLKPPYFRRGLIRACKKMSLEFEENLLKNQVEES